MSLRFHEIAEGDHRIMNPITDGKMMRLGELCRLRAGMQLLDLACGKGEMLCRWAGAHGITGVGVDHSAVFLAAARQRADELNVAEQVTFVESDAGAYARQARPFDVVSCLGASWIGDGLQGTLELMKPALGNPDGLLLVGEPYWIEEPPAAAYVAMNVQGDTFTTLPGTLERLEAAGLELVEMLRADADSWDRYEASQWFTIYEWLRANPDDAIADDLRAWNDHNRRTHLTYGGYMGWAVFVLKLR